MPPNHPEHQSSGGRSLGSLLGVVVAVAALWLVGAPLQHTLAHGVEESAQGPVDGSDDPSCLVCTVLAASPAVDGASPPDALHPFGPWATVIFPNATAHPRGLGPHGGDRARAPPRLRSAPTSVADRPRSS